MDIIKYYFLKQLDGKYHIYKKQERSREVRLIEMCVTDDPDEARDMANELNAEEESDDDRLLNI